MIIKIKKRDGRMVTFNIEKIANAIYKAAESVGQEDQEESLRLAGRVVDLLLEKKLEVPTVEEIQDCVERVLIEEGMAETAKSYILYRSDRTRAREMDTRLMRVYEELTFKSAEDNDLKRENANIDGDTAMGTMLKYGSVGAKEFNEMYVLEPEHSRAHIEGDIHIHDLDFYTLTTTCTQIDLTKLFDKGFSTGHGYLRTPNDIQSYAALACIAIQSNQNDQHGGQSLPKFDYDMAQGVKKTFKHRYRDNIGRGLALLGGVKDSQNVAKKLAEMLDEQGLVPTLSNDNGYQEAESQFLVNFCDARDVTRIQAFAYKNSVKETDRATYQAMEALIHNLNTMNSRAGAQTPFSSPLSRAEWSSRTFSLPRRQASETVRHLSSRYIFLR